jgi:hypothetical protein
MHRIAMVGVLVAFGAAIGPSGSASALTMEECGTKYKAAQAAGTLGAMKWNDFRKAKCSDEAQAAPVAATAPASPGEAEPAAAPTGNVVFPSAIAPGFANEKPARARLHTCAAQYKANKAGGANGGLKWIQKGGGYYSQCNAKLKG